MLMETRWHVLFLATLHIGVNSPKRGNRRLVTENDSDNMTRGHGTTGLSETMSNADQFLVGNSLSVSSGK